MRVPRCPMWKTTFDRLTPLEGSIRFLMSGRCAILCALEDWKPTDRKRVAYVPAYTCGTVLAPYAKAGYRLKFYEVDRNMTPVFLDLDEATVPSHFTVLAEHRDALQAWLEEQGIHTTAYWAKSPLADTTACPQAAYIYDHVLSLPCDQRYTPTDMERIAQAVRAFLLSEI